MFKKKYMTLPVIIQLLNTFKEPLFNVTKDFKEEFVNAFNSGLNNYLENYYDKYSKTKTFIYREERVDFYDIFYPVTLSQKGQKLGNITDLKELFKNGNFLTIIGSAGSGKSMLMKHIFLSTIKQSFRIPIVVELRNLNDFNGTLFDYISEIILRNRLNSSKKIIQRALNDGSFLFLFDGYDEIFSSSKDKITKQIEDFVDTYNKNIFVVTSRPGANCESLERFDNYRVQSLSKNQIVEFINLQYKNEESKESSEKIISVIENPQNKDYKEYLSNPLLLSMFIFTFNNYPELPKSKNKFYWNVFDTLCTKHDSFTKKGSWLHERKSKLLNEDFENILKWFSYITIFKGKYNFDEAYLKSMLLDIKDKLSLTVNHDDLVYDLTVSIAILILDGTDYTFPHKSLQEYFCAYLIKGLNEDQKQKIYSEKFNHLSSFSTGGNLNFYKLCYELDKHYFTKYFLIPRAKDFISTIDNSSDEKLIKSFMKEFRLSFGFTKDFKIGTMTSGALASDSFLSFFKNQRCTPEFSDLNRTTALASLKKSFNSEIPRSINLQGKWNENLQFYVDKSGLLKHFKILYKEIQEGIIQMEKEIEKDKVSTSQLLDI